MKAKTRNEIRGVAKKRGWEHERAWDVFRPGDTFKDSVTRDRVFIEYCPRSGRIYRVAFNLGGIEWTDWPRYVKGKKHLAHYLLTRSTQKERKEIADRWPQWRADSNVSPGVDGANDLPKGPHL